MIPNLALANSHQKSVDQAVALAAADTLDLMSIIGQQPVPVLARELRANLPAITTVYSTVVGQLAVNYYDEARNGANVVAAYAANAAEYAVETEVQKAIGYSMALTTNGSTVEAVESTLVGHVQRIVNNVNRETITQNINKDPSGIRYQRVPSAGACSFCMTVAAVAELTTEDYYTQYHSFCHCKTIPVFAGQTPYRPAYYDEFQNEYYKAVGELSSEREEVGYSNYKRNTASKMFPDLTITTPNILRKIRANTGRS